MRFNYSKLRGKIREIYQVQDNFARAINISPASLSGKLNNHVEFTQEEIMAGAKMLNIPDGSIHEYFFCARS
jgi:hypothetical protein